ncbi:uncharacterized protein [Typha latifolia]|uniref:uncharacterized protein n=1 Tax=Typha latifolia TaxID=4733 RepID=UPI003C2E1661
MGERGRPRSPPPKLEHGDELEGRRGLSDKNRQESSWVKLLRAKYGELNPWIPSVLARASWVWRALVNTAVTIRGGCRKQIGNGRTTKAASEPWLFAGQADRLVEEAGRDLAFQIGTTELTEAAGPDRWIWWLERAGEPKAKSFYAFIHPRCQDSWAGWTDLWRLRVASRVRLFAWKLLWGRLPTWARLYAMRVGPD